MNEALRCRCPFDFALGFRVISSASQRPIGFDDVLGRLGPHVAVGIETGSSGAPRKLMEFAGLKHTYLLAIKFCKRAEEHRAYRDIDADAKGIRAANHREKSFAGKLLHETAIAGEHARMMHTHTIAKVPSKRLTKAGRQFLALHRSRNGLSLFTSGERQRH